MKIIYLIVFSFLFSVLTIAQDHPANDSTSKISDVASQVTDTSKITVADTTLLIVTDTSNVTAADSTNASATDTAIVKIIDIITGELHQGLTEPDNKG